MNKTFLYFLIIVFAFSLLIALVIDARSMRYYYLNNRISTLEKKNEDLVEKNLKLVQDYASLRKKKDKCP